MDNQNKAVAARIKELRIAKEMSQTKLARSLNLTVTAYNRLENDKTQLTVNMLFAIAIALDVSVSYLLNLSAVNSVNRDNTLIANFVNGCLHLQINAEYLEKFLPAK